MDYSEKSYEQLFGEMVIIILTIDRGLEDSLSFPAGITPESNIYRIIIFK